jgi:hypothetical protein
MIVSKSCRRRGNDGRKLVVQKDSSVLETRLAERGAYLSKLLKSTKSDDESHARTPGLSLLSGIAAVSPLVAASFLCERCMCLAS